MQNSFTIDGLISFILKPRDNNCPISLWVAERIAERRLLNDDGIEMSEDTWLELLLAFVTNEEKQTLQVPAREQRAAFDGGAGYDVLALQRSLNRFDPATFRKYQQSHCHDPVALRVIALHRLVTAEKMPGNPARPRPRAELESHATEKGPAPASTTKTNDKFDKKSSLPAKEGKPDQTLYASFPERSLRRRLWDAVASGTCSRCAGPHLRVACPKPRQSWEDDFEKEGFFTKPPPFKDGETASPRSTDGESTQCTPCSNLVRSLFFWSVPRRHMLRCLRRETRRPDQHSPHACRGCHRASRGRKLSG